MARRASVLLALTAVLLALPGAASATVTVDRTSYRFQPGGGGSGISTLDVLRLRGDRSGDAVGVRRRGGRLVITARRGTVVARGPACRQRGRRTVTCPTGLRSLDAVLGAGDDTLVLHTRFSRRVVAGGSGDDVLEDRFTRCLSGCSPVPGVGGLDGGPGDDRLLGQELTGGPGNDLLTGTAAADRLDPGAGRDRVVAGAGDDRLDLADDDPDLLDGGPGSDTADHGRSTDPVTVDLATGSGDDGDQLAAIENAEGGREADVLRGDDGPNALADGDLPPENGGQDRTDLLDGRGGADRLAPGTGDTALGGDGDDVVDGAARRATVDAGPGDDRVRVTSSGPTDGNDLRCGPGDDAVDGPAVGDLVRADCERVRGAASLTTRSPAPDRTALTLTFVPTVGTRTCRVELVVFADPTRTRTLGQAAADLGPQGGAVTVPFDAPLPPGVADVAIQYRLTLCPGQGADVVDATTTGPFRIELP